MVVNSAWWWFSNALLGTILLLPHKKVCASSALCPVSREFETAKDHRYGYPPGLYGKSLLHGINLTSYSCSHYGTVQPALHCLSNHEVCPVRPENIATVMGPSTWPQYAAAFRRIHQASTEKPEIIIANIFILGGSMTHGSETKCACECYHHIDSRCPAAPLEKCSTVRCSWSTVLEPWLHHHFPRIKWSVHDYASSGMDSRRMADSIGDDLRFQNVTFTDNDIVFLDHSVNDVIQTGKHGIQLPLVFELLVRRILAISYVTNARPTIVVIEQYAHNSAGDAEKRKFANATRAGDYAHVYRQISKHYGLILWSIRDVYWSYYQTISPNMGANDTSTPAERLYQIDPFHKIHVLTHPPWYIHLFVADVLAACMLEAMSAINNNTSELGGTTGGNGTNLLNLQWIPQEAALVKHTLPPPLYDALSLSDEYAVCDVHSPYLLDAQPHTSYRPKDTVKYESDARTVGKTGWREYIDYHDTPGWIINDLSHPSKRVLTFPIAACAKSSSSAKLSADSCYTGKMLRILYLRSYTGMGRVNVHICGKLADKGHEHGRSTIDGLEELEPYSVSNVYIHSLLLAEARRCDALPPAARTVEIIYDPSSAHDTNDAARVEHHRKFKLLQVQMCSAAPRV